MFQVFKHDIVINYFLRKGILFVNNYLIYHRYILCSPYMLLPYSSYSWLDQSLIRLDQSNSKWKKIRSTLPKIWKRVVERLSQSDYCEDWNYRPCRIWDHYKPTPYVKWIFGEMEKKISKERKLMRGEEQENRWSRCVETERHVASYFSVPSTCRT